MPKNIPAEPLESLEVDPEVEAPQKTEVIAPVKNNRTSPLFNFLVQFLVVAVLFFAIGFSVGQKKVTLDKKSLIPKFSITGELSQTQTLDFSLFWDVFNLLPQKYLDKSVIDGQKMMYGAISGMVASLGDPYTAFLDPKQNESIKSEISGTYEGVGIQLGFDREKRLVVIAPLKGTPAERAGVLPKDLILKIDEIETFDMTLPKAVDLIRGDAGTGGKIQFFREGGDKPFEKELAR